MLDYSPMVKKILTISFTSLAALLIAASPAFASKGSSHNYHNKVAKSEIVYDLPDSGDNAHPSGKDRSVEPGRSLTQGKSKSDPDDNGKGPERSHGKSDKPGSVGGVDKFDQDGNNGCGNDDDFEDDNEGWCGQKPKKDKPSCEKDCSEHKNDGCKPENPAKPSTPKTPKNPPVVLTTAQPAVGQILSLTTLPKTGIESETSYNWVLVAFALISTGAAVRLVTRKYEAFTQ